MSKPQIASLLLLIGACSPKPAADITMERAEHGYTGIFVGIFGNQDDYNDMERALVECGYRGAIEVVDWTLGKSMFLLNMRASARNRNRAKEHAAKIMLYQDKFPDRPVNLIGHSGGAGFCTMILEALPQGRKVTAVVLLAPAMPPKYDLTEALKRVDVGMWVAYSKADVAYLKTGTTLIGTYGGASGEAAGLTGFARPSDLSPEGKRLYDTKLRQKGWDDSMRALGHDGGHYGYFAHDYVVQRMWPGLCWLPATRNP